MLYCAVLCHPSQGFWYPLLFQVPGADDGNSATNSAASELLRSHGWAGEGLVLAVLSGVGGDREAAGGVLDEMLAHRLHHARRSSEATRRSSEAARRDTPPQGHPPRCSIALCHGRQTQAALTPHVCSVLSVSSQFARWYGCESSRNRGCGCSCSCLSAVRIRAGELLDISASELAPPLLANYCRNK